MKIAAIYSKFFYWEIVFFLRLRYSEKNVWNCHGIRLFLNAPGLVSVRKIMDSLDSSRSSLLEGRTPGEKNRFCEIVDQYHSLRTNWMLILSRSPKIS